jgi:Ca2+:H+ antiporter
MSDIFVGVFVVALVGNAAEHSTAILVARKNKMDLAVQIAVGSSLQIALLIAPTLVFVSYLFGRPLDLLFTTFEIAAVALSIGVLNLIALDGESNWMEGVLLLAVYAILGMAFYTLQP